MNHGEVQESILAGRGHLSIRLFTEPSDQFTLRVRACRAADVTPVAAEVYPGWWVDVGGRQGQ